MTLITTVLEVKFGLDKVIDHQLQEARNRSGLIREFHAKTTLLIRCAYLGGAFTEEQQQHYDQPRAILSMDAHYLPGTQHISMLFQQTHSNWSMGYALTKIGRFSCRKNILSAFATLDLDCSQTGK